MLRTRARLVSVLSLLLVGAIALIASTQTWYSVALHDVTEHPLTVSGTAALPVLAPLALAAIAMAAALAIVGRVMRLIFGVLTLAIGVLLTALAAPLTFSQPIAAVASTVTEATFISGNSAIASLVNTITPTVWPAITLICGVVVCLAGLFILFSSRHWSTTGRRYSGSAATRVTAAGPVDAIDGWDGLSRGIDPTGVGDADTPPPSR